MLGICYGQQLMAHLLGGNVRKGDKGEYGLATLDLDERLDPVSQACGRAADLDEPSRYGRAASRRLSTFSAAPTPARSPPSPTRRAASTACSFTPKSSTPRRAPDPHQLPLRHLRLRARLGSAASRAAGRAAHPRSGRRPQRLLLRQRRRRFDRRLHALPARPRRGRVSGFYVDTGLMREGETALRPRTYSERSAATTSWWRRPATSSSARSKASSTRRRSATSSASSSSGAGADPRTGHFLDGNWILGQGTIYPDTIESGGTAKADLIKTHHNRVAGIQKLIDEGRIVEPLTYFYKDEVREIGRELGLPAELLDRHPFPGPGPGDPLPVLARRSAARRRSKAAG